MGCAVSALQSPARQRPSHIFFPPVFWGLYFTGGLSISLLHQRLHVQLMQKLQQCAVLVRKHFLQGPELTLYRTLKGCGSRGFLERRMMDRSPTGRHLQHGPGHITPRYSLLPQVLHSQQQAEQLQ